MAEKIAKTKTVKAVTKPAVAATKPVAKKTAVKAAVAAPKSVAKAPAAAAKPATTKPAATKPVAVKKPPAAKPAAKKPASKAMIVTDEQRYRMVAEAAYYRAESNQFKSDPVRDWIQAESDIATLLSGN
ncbi:MAG: DUF2934 domain-containing protein [Betaproteobacteria bacterium]